MPPDSVNYSIVGHVHKQFRIIITASADAGTPVGVLLPAYSIFSSPKQILVMF